MSEPETSLTDHWRKMIRQWRQEGKTAWLYERKQTTVCPYEQGTLEFHCWGAGYSQRVASEDQLWHEYQGVSQIGTSLKPEGSK